MNLKLRRKLTYATIVLFNLSTGIGYAIVFPTIWNYVHKRFGGDASMLGIVISAYSVSSFFSNPFVGWWGDKTQNTQVILLLTVAAEIIGSIMYFIGIANWFLVLSRLVAGFGGGGGAAVFADITRTTPEDERTPVLSMVVASRQLGLLIGPALNLFLSRAHFYIGSFPVDQYTSPGLFMAGLWIIVEFAVIFMYHNLTALKTEEDMDKFFQEYEKNNSVFPETERTSELEASSSVDITFTSSYPNYSVTVGTPSSLMSNQCVSVPNLSAEALKDFENDTRFSKNDIKTINCKKIFISSGDSSMYTRWPPKTFRSVSEQSGNISNVTDSMIESAERFIQSASESFQPHTNAPTFGRLHGDASSHRTSDGNNTSLAYDSQPSASEEKIRLLQSMNVGFVRDEVIALLGLSFISAFAQTALETVVTPLAQRFYNFGEMENSYIYLFAGIEIICVFISIKFLSRKFSDRSLIVFGLLTLGIATVMPMIYLPSAVPGELETLPYFIITVIVDLIGIGIIVVCAASLLSKVVSVESQALSQGLRRSMSSLGCILGPLWGGAYLHKIYFLFAVPLSVTVLIMVLFLCSYRRFV